MIYTHLAAALVSAGLGFAGGIWAHIKLDDAAELKRVRAEAIQQEAQARATHTIMEKRDAEIRAVNDRLADAIERLRKRPERRAEAATDACQGATGAQLSGPDGGFLEREAARADQLRSALGECYGWIDAVTR